MDLAPLPCHCLILPRRVGSSINSRELRVTSRLLLEQQPTIFFFTAGHGGHDCGAVTCGGTERASERHASGRGLPVTFGFLCGGPLITSEPAPSTSPHPDLTAHTPFLSLSHSYIPRKYPLLPLSAHAVYCCSGPIRRIKSIRLHGSYLHPHLDETTLPKH